MPLDLRTSTKHTQTVVHQHPYIYSTGHPGDGFFIKSLPNAHTPPTPGFTLIGALIVTLKCLSECQTHFKRRDTAVPN